MEPEKKILTNTDIDNIEAAALGRTGVGVFAHPTDTLLLVREISKLREEDRKLRGAVDALLTYLADFDVIYRVNSYYLGHQNEASGKILADQINIVTKLLRERE